MGMSTLFFRAAELHAALGLEPLNRAPGLWVQDLGEGWQIKVNGHPKIIDGIPHCHLVGLYRGLPVVFCTPDDGLSVGGPDPTTGRTAEDDLVAALERAIREAGATPQDVERAPQADRGRA